MLFRSCCSAACGIFPDQGSKPCPLHWQADSQPLRHQGSPRQLILSVRQEPTLRPWEGSPFLQQKSLITKRLYWISTFKIYQFSWHFWVVMLPRNWVCLLVSVEPKDTTEPKMGRRKDLLLAASKENTRYLSQSSVSPNSKIGEVLS